mgnify:CR=1 FL=1
MFETISQCNRITLRAGLQRGCGVADPLAWTLRSRSWPSPPSARPPLWGLHQRMLRLRSTLYRNSSTLSSTFHLAFPFDISIWHFHSRFPFGISIWDFHLAFPFDISIWDFHLAVPLKISIRDFHSAFPFGISIWDFHLAFPFVISIWHFHLRFPFGISIWQQQAHKNTTNYQHKTCRSHAGLSSQAIRMWIRQVRILNGAAVLQYVLKR